MSHRLPVCWLRGRMIDVTDVQCFALLRFVSFGARHAQLWLDADKASQTVMSPPIGHQSSDVVMSLLAVCWLRLRVGRQTGANRVDGAFPELIVLYAK